jgi:two-component sensor histidine kinase
VLKEPSIESETPDERTIRLLNAEVALLRKRAGHSDKSIRRVEAVADAAAARFAERSLLFGKEIALLRKRVANSHERERGLRGVAKASLAQSAERGAMLHEVNHRAKNSIQMAISLLNLQRHASDNPQFRLSLASAVERLSHIARVHSMLYGHSPDIDVVCHGFDELTLDSSRAINLALITSEGVTNALKHAFPDGRAGTISVECRRDNGFGILTIQDNGIGMADDKGKKSMGMKLIRTMVKGIGGKLLFESVEGTRLQVTFPFQ